MGKKFVQPHKHKIDKIFSQPPGSEQAFVVTDGSEQFLTQSIQNGQTSSTDTTDFFTGLIQDVEINLATPNVFAVIDQRIRRGPGGQTFVDIVIEVEDIEFATEYEASIAKAVT